MPAVRFASGGQDGTGSPVTVGALAARWRTAASMTIASANA
jgi:hypothetical protein